MSPYEFLPADERTLSPVCSICIANYNGADLLAACLDSIRGQQNAPRIEVLLHDDASTDSSVALVREQYPEVSLLISRENVGFCVSNNRMVEHAAGEFILLLNNDAELFPDALVTLLEFSEQQQMPGILTLSQFDRASRKNIDFGNDLDIFLNPVPRHSYRGSEVGTVHGACMWIPTTLWERMGGFPVWFESIGEDLYLCALSRALGYTVEVPMGSGYWHWVGQSFGGGRPKDHKLSTTYRRRALSERNKTIIMVLLYPWYLFPLLLLHCFLLVMEGLILSVLSRDGKIWSKIYGKACRGLLSRFKFFIQERSHLRRLHRMNSWLLLRSLSLFPHKLRLLGRHGIPSIK